MAYEFRFGNRSQGAAPGCVIHLWQPSVVVSARRNLGGANGHALLRRQSHHPARAREGRERRSGLPRPAVQFERLLQRAVQGAGRARKPRPDGGVRGHLALERDGGKSLRRGDAVRQYRRRRDAARHALVPARQRHDGVSRDDGGAADRTASRVEADG